VVVATRDRAECLDRLLGALERQALEPASFEVVVVDDGSRDRTPELLAARAGESGFELRAIPGPGGRGPAAARNRGWRAATAELVAFTDDDCEPAPQWLERLLAASGPGRIVQGLTVPNPSDRPAGTFRRTKSIDPPTPFFQTCNIAYPRELLERLGGFDERFTGPAGEDADLGWRALEGGAEHRAEPLALVHHAVEGLDTLTYLRQATRGSETAIAYRRHPGLRRAATYRRIFWNRAQARLLLAIAALLLARRMPVAALLATPYVKGLLGRARSEAGTPTVALILVAYDFLHLGTSLRASMRHRILVL
jgi:glycosyltransferase involved in cell wall biosynthesis